MDVVLRLYDLCMITACSADADLHFRIGLCRIIAKKTVFARILDIFVNNVMFDCVKRPVLVITTQKSILESKFVNSVKYKVCWFAFFPSGFVTDCNNVFIAFSPRKIACL